MGDDPSLKIVSNGIKLKANYQIKMFKFIGEELNDVWLHCTVRACNSTIPENCLPECGNDRSKRSLRKKKQKKKKLWYVSGPHEIMTELPIQRKMTAEELEAGLDNFYGREKDTSLLEPCLGTTCGCHAEGYCWSDCTLFGWNWFGQPWCSTINHHLGEKRGCTSHRECWPDWKCSSACWAFGGYPGK